MFMLAEVWGAQTDLTREQQEQEQEQVQGETAQTEPDPTGWYAKIVINVT